MSSTRSSSAPPSGVNCSRTCPAIGWNSAGSSSASSGCRANRPWRVELRELATLPANVRGPAVMADHRPARRLGANVVVMDGFYSGPRPKRQPSEDACELRSEPLRIETEETRSGPCCRGIRLAAKGGIYHQAGDPVAFPCSIATPEPGRPGV